MYTPALKWRGSQFPFFGVLESNVPCKKDSTTRQGIRRLGQHKRVLSEIQEMWMWAKFSFHKCFRNTSFFPKRAPRPKISFLLKQLFAPVWNALRLFAPF